MTQEFADDMQTEEIRVSGSTPPRELAGSIKFHLEKGATVTLSAIGHQAVSQGLKAVPIVNGLLAPQGKLLAVFPSFDVKHIPSPTGGEPLERTACMMLLVAIRPR